MSAPSIHSSTCCHVYRSTGETCGKPVTLIRPHGWLCDEHESVIAKYNSLKTADRMAS